MKHDQSNYLLLATVTLLLVMSTALLNYKDNLQADSAPLRYIKNPLDELTIEKAYSSLQHLIASRSVGTIVQMLQGVSAERSLSLAHMILASKNTALTREDKAQILLGLVQNNSTDIKKQYLLLDMLKQFRDLKKDKPILISAIHSEYAGAIPVILAWMKDRNLDELSIFNAYNYAINKNDVAGFAKLGGYGVSITQTQATQLLQHVVTQKGLPEFIPLLVDLEANIDVASHGKTLLMQAVLQNNSSLVEALLKAGAHKNINKIIDPKVGSALQLAIEKSYTDIDIMLRNYGARE